MSSTAAPGTDRVVIGMDPHKRSATIEVMRADETVAGGGRFGTDRDGYAAMLRCSRQWPDRVWAVEGCDGIGRHIANRLLADGEEVVDVPPKLSARARVFATGQGRKTDATDAHSVALVGTRMTGLRPVVNDEQLAVLRILVDRRRSMGEDHTRMVSQLHQVLLELIPGGAKKDLSARQAKALLAKVRPRDAAGKTRRRVAAELISDLERVYARKKAANKELTELLAATGTGLLDLNGIGPSGAARLLVEVGDITRFPNKDTFHLIRAGVAGGKTVPETVAENPLVFATVTAPSFGRVHGRRDGARRCQAAVAGPRVCLHGRPRTCQASHDDGDPLLGQPLCGECYDYASHVVWQWWAPDLWRRFTIALRRLVAKTLDVPASRLGDVATVQYAKVAEY